MMMHPVTLGILWAAICMAHGNKAAKVDGAVCNTTECQQLVSQIKAQREGTEPCQDFYKYVCGKWEGSRELKERKFKEKALKDLIALLDVISPPSGNEYNATEKLVSAYKSCTRTGKEEEELRKAVNSILATYGFAGWPMLEENNAPKSSDYKEILKQVGPRPIFEYSASVEDSTPTIIMTKPKEFFVDVLGDIDYIFARSLSARDDGNSGTTVDYSYDDYDRKADEAYEEFIAQVIKLLNGTLEQEKISETAKSIIAFEKQLHNFSSRAAKSTTEKTIQDIIDTLGDSIPMDKILEKDFSVINFTIKEDTKVKFEYADYYTNTVAYIKDPNRAITFMNYIMWVFIRGMAKAEGTTLHEYYLQYKNKTSISPVTEEGKDIKMRCILQLLQHNVMYSASANFYSKYKFGKESKEEVMKIMHYVNTTFQYIIENNQWMTNHTKAELLGRLNNITLVLGYPDWLMDDGIIDTLYMFVPTIPLNESFVKHYHYLRQNNHYEKLLMLNSSLYVDKKHEGIALRSHAYYDEATNTAAYPAAALATNFRRPPIPRATNFGTVGTVLAQLLTSVVDRYQKQRLSNGSIVKVDFWDNGTTAKFCQNSQCLNNSQECSGEEYCYSYSHQKLEDYVGVRVSHTALHRSKSNYSEPFLLPDPSLDTEDKIFFNFFGSLYCPYSVNTKKPPEEQAERRVQERTDEEGFSFEKSLNEVVSMYSKFNDTFNCTGTISDTCTLVPEEQIYNIGC